MPTNMVAEVVPMLTTPVRAHDAHGTGNIVYNDGTGFDDGFGNT